jgi:hypothetical protein
MHAAICYLARWCGLLGYGPPGCRDIAKYHHYYQLIFHTVMFIKIRFVSYGEGGVLGPGGKTSRITQQQVIVLNIAIARAWNGGLHQDAVKRFCVQVTRVRTRDFSYRHDCMRSGRGTRFEVQYSQRWRKAPGNFAAISVSWKPPVLSWWRS